jgi:hypothetical protein
VLRLSRGMSYKAAAAGLVLRWRKSRNHRRKPADRPRANLPRARALHRSEPDELRSMSSRKEMRRRRTRNDPFRSLRRSSSVRSRPFFFVDMHNGAGVDRNLATVGPVLKTCNNSHRGELRAAALLVGWPLCDVGRTRAGARPSLNNSPTHEDSPRTPKTRERSCSPRRAPGRDCRQPRRTELAPAGSSVSIGRGK